MYLHVFMHVSGTQHVMLLYWFSGVPVETEADPPAELQRASTDQSPAARREGIVGRRQTPRASLTPRLGSD